MLKIIPQRFSTRKLVTLTEDQKTLKISENHQRLLQMDQRFGNYVENFPTQSKDSFIRDIPTLSQRLHWKILVKTIFTMCTKIFFINMFPDREKNPFDIHHIENVQNFFLIRCQILWATFKLSSANFSRILFSNHTVFLILFRAKFTLVSFSKVSWAALPLVWIHPNWTWSHLIT